MIVLKIPMQDLDKIKASDDLKSKTLQTITNKKKKRNPFPLFVPSAIVICLIVIVSYNPFTSPQPVPEISMIQPYSYISIDINPSLELQLDQGDNVISIITYNEEAKTLLKEINVNGMNAKDAISRIVEDRNTENYIVNGYLQISVYSEDEQHSKDLEALINESLSGTLDASQYGCSNSSKSNYEAASSHHMSFGKYQVMDMVIDLDSTYTIEELQKYSMMELKNLYESISGQNLPEEHNSNSGKHNGRNNHHD